MELHPNPASGRHPVAPNSRPAALAKLDQRTREARMMRDTRAELTAHVGGHPSATQRALIEQAVQLQLRLAVMDRSFAEAGGTMTAHDSRTYLAWSNSYSRLLRQLGQKAAAERGPSLADYLATKATVPPASAPPAASTTYPHHAATSEALPPVAPASAA
jgi:hypothetical protein